LSACCEPSPLFNLTGNHRFITVWRPRTRVAISEPVLEANYGFRQEADRGFKG
jgi:hypothetical protein